MNTTDEKPNVQETLKSEEYANASLFQAGVSKPERLSKAEKKAARYERLKTQRRAQRKEKKEKAKEKRRQMVDSGIDVPRRTGLKKMAESKCHIRVAIDCSHDSLMSVKDICKLSNQIGTCYGLNRRTENPLQFYVTGLGGQLKERFEAIGTSQQEYLTWDLNFCEADYDRVFPRGEIIYLTAESDNLLTELSDQHVYVIGGLVDHNHHRGHCHESVTCKEIATARLPLSEHLKLSQRAVLSIVHVFDALLKFSEIGDWGESLRRVVPKRKWAEPSEAGGEASSQTSDVDQSTTSNDQSETGREIPQM